MKELLKTAFLMTCKGVKLIFVSFITGQFIVSLVRHLIKVAGNVAESAFMLSAIYVTINNVAHLFVMWILPASWIILLDQIAVILLAVLPELIVTSAIVRTYDHWTIARITKSKGEVMWAVGYTVPTVIFLVMTAFTLSTFTSAETSEMAIPTATGLALTIRCLTGWYYGVLQMVYAERKKSSHASHLVKMQGDLAKVKGDLDLTRGDLKKVKSENESLKRRLTRSKGEPALTKGDLKVTATESAQLKTDPLSSNGNKKVIIV